MEPTTITTAAIPQHEAITGAVTKLEGALWACSCEDQDRWCSGDGHRAECLLCYAYSPDSAESCKRAPQRPPHERTCPILDVMRAAGMQVDEDENLWVCPDGGHCAVCDE